jgi:hypothetical protein
VILAAVTLVHFPEFQDLHEAIFEVLDTPSYVSMQCHTYNSQQWEIYFKYRQFLSEFLMDQGHSGTLFVGVDHYLKLAKYFWSFLMSGTLNLYHFTLVK